MLYQVAGDDILAHIFAVLRAHNDGVDALGNAVLVLDGYLRLAVGTQVWQGLVLTKLRHALAELVREGYGQGHEFGRLVACEPDHHALVARADRFEVVVVAAAVAHFKSAVNAVHDVRGLLMHGDGDAAGLVIEAVSGVDVAGVADGCAHDSSDVHVGGGGNLAHDDDKARRRADLAGDARPGVVGDDGIKNRVRNLVAELVRVSLCYRF